jgi:hypothetical protein
MTKTQTKETTVFAMTALLLAYVATLVLVIVPVIAAIAGWF